MQINQVLPYGTQHENQSVKRVSCFGKTLSSVGFEPTSANTFGPKPNPLDHSGKMTRKSSGTQYLNTEQCWPDSCCCLRSPDNGILVFPHLCV